MQAIFFASLEIRSTMRARSGYDSCVMSTNSSGLPRAAKVEAPVERY